jgi:hypothetical protein
VNCILCPLNSPGAQGNRLDAINGGDLKRVR